MKTKNNLVRIFSLLSTAVAICFLNGCATPASQTSMTVDKEELHFKRSDTLKGQMRVAVVSGGTETNPMWKSKVDNVAFQGALDQSLTLAGYKAINSDNARYQIEVMMQDLDQPSFGLTYDVRSTVLYTVKSDNGLKTFPVTAVGTATTSDAFMAIERLKIANERSIKENIKQFIQDVSAYFSSIPDGHINSDKARDKCTEIGFVQGTENFEKCISKILK